MIPDRGTPPRAFCSIGPQELNNIRRSIATETHIRHLCRPWESHHILIEFPVPPQVCNGYLPPSKLHILTSPFATAAFPIEFRETSSQQDVARPLKSIKQPLGLCKNLWNLCKNHCNLCKAHWNLCKESFKSMQKQWGPMQKSLRSMGNLIL